LPAEILEKFAGMDILVSAVYLRRIGTTAGEQAELGAAPDRRGI
jgi:hypothetical protein